MALGLAFAGEAGKPAGRAFLEQRDVPLGGTENIGEFPPEVAVDPDVGLARDVPPRPVATAKLQLGLRWPISPMEEVPADDVQLHARSIGGFVTDHFLTGSELDSTRLEALLDRAAELKQARDAAAAEEQALDGRSVALVFEKPSTRTRISFEVAVAELGGTPVVLRGDELQLTRGESIADTGRVLSRYVHAIAIRSGSHDAVEELAGAAEVPVINALTPQHHPCQALADLLTLRERFGSLQGLRLAYVGDGNNVARSLAILGRTAGVDVVIAAPEGYRLEDELGIEQLDDPTAAAKEADALYTDIWVSMGDEAQAEARRGDLAPFQLNSDLLAAASDRAVVMHCLPAHPGEEITEDLLYGDRSAVWDQAENRLHAQKALLESLLG